MTLSQTNKLEKYQISALKGSVIDIINELDTIPDSSLNESELKLKHDFLNRFQYKNDTIVLNTDNDLIKDIYEIYSKYWYDVLMEVKPEKQADSELESELRVYFSKLSGTSLPEDIFEYERNIIKTNNINTANGKTAGIYDLLLWAKEDTVVYDVELPEGNTNVSVVFMDSIISMGWEEYATFGRYYPGGWATENSLYCAKTAYDTSNENFLISYLKHEGQHFADYKLYPKLSGADLEYRAKLVELSYTTESIHKLISFFIRNSGTDRNNTHSFANYHVIKALSEELFGQGTEVVNAEEWKKFNYSEINKASKKLYMQNSEALRKQGRDVNEFIN